MSYKRWTEKELEYLKETYGKKSNGEIAKALQRSENAVFKKAKRLSLTEVISHWSHEEINFLMNKWGFYSISKIAKNLNRSNEAIRQKAIKLELGPARIGNGEFLTTGDVGYLLKKDPCIVYKWIKDGHLKARNFGEKKISQITPTDFMSFIKTHPEKWDATKARTELIQGYLHNSFKLPCWFKGKIEKDKIRFRKRISQ